MTYPDIETKLCFLFRAYADKEIKKFKEEKNSNVAFQQFQRENKNMAGEFLSKATYEKQKQDAIDGLEAQYRSLLDLFETTKENPDAFLDNDLACGGSLFWKEFLVSHYRDHFNIEVSCLGYEVDEKGDELPHMVPDL